MPSAVSAGRYGARMSSPTPPNWYPDPNNPTLVRWWDGQRWTEHVHEAVQSSDESPVEPAAQRDGADRAPTPEEQVVPSSEPASRRRIGFFGARSAARDFAEENDQLRAALAEAGSLELAEIQLRTAAARKELSDLEAQTAAVRQDLGIMRQQVLDVRDAIDVQEFGLYDFEHPAEVSARLAAELSALRVAIKQCVGEKRATTSIPSFTFDGSAAKGRKFIRDMSQMMLAAYNAEAENAIKTVKAGNLSTATARLEKAAERVMRNGSMIQLQITGEYHQLRVRELAVAARHLAAVQAAKEAERARRAELREAKRVEDELKRERAKLDKEREHYVNALAALEARGDDEGVAELREKLAGIDAAIEDVDYRAANVRAGYVYVVSNVGSMGDNIVKIGMTRRLDPMDRIRELSDASVPFNFDVHALFFSEDAFGVEAMLHRHFADRRVNRVNLRREFFYATPAEVLEGLQEHNVAVVEYRTEATAEEFRASREIGAAAPGGL